MERTTVIIVAAAAAALIGTVAGGIMYFKNRKNAKVEAGAADIVETEDFVAAGA